MKTKAIIKSVTLISSMFLFMGNSGCENEEARRSGRILKREASLLGITSRRISIGDSLDIDLAGILNDQMLTEVNNNDYFVSRSVFSPASFNQKLNNYKSVSGSFQPLASNVSSSVCTNDLPDIMISGAATEFEMTTSGGVSIGLDGVTNGVLDSLDVDLKRMSMGLDLQAYEPLTASHTGASVSVRGVKADWSFGLFTGLLNFRFQRPDEVAKVIRRTLTSALNSLGRRIEELEFSGNHDKWAARVYAENDTHILVNAGKKHGLQVGDFLWVSNMDYTWEGAACNSKLRFQRPRQTVESPLAIVEITKIGLDSAEARVVQQTHLKDIEEGAKAYVFKLKEEPKVEEPAPSSNSDEDDDDYWGSGDN